VPDYGVPVERALHLLARIPAGPIVAVISILGLLQMQGTPAAAQRVPELEGLDVNRAVAVAAGDGFFTKVEFTPGGGVAGTVTRQSPEAEVISTKRSTIVLRVTKGVAQLKVPDVRRLPVDEARRRIADGHLTAGAVTYTDDPDIESNHVITSDPKPNALVDIGTTVDLVAAT
jgi:beta-lactam-binding protein with PASTA domain